MSYPHRFHYMDNLRAGAMLLGLVFHAALAYSATMNQLWPTADTSNSKVVDFFLWLSNAFRMPLFFLVAGFFANLLVSKQGIAAFLKNRFLRIVLPFLVFLPLVSLLTAVILWLAIDKFKISTVVLDAVRTTIQQPSEQQELQPLGTGHLWFLYYLAIFCCFAALAKRYLPRIDFCDLSKPLFLLCILPLLTFLSLLGKNVPHPPPSRFMPEFWALVFYGVFFLAGWLYYRNQNMIDFLFQFRFLILAACLIVYFIFFLQVPDVILLSNVSSYFRSAPEMSVSHVTAVAASALIAWYASFLCLIFAREYFNFKSETIRYLSDASYWLYLVHLPIVFAMQVLFHQIDFPIVVELVFSLGVTLGLGLLTYVKWVRYTRVGIFLNGKRMLRKDDLPLCNSEPEPIKRVIKINFWK